MIPLFNHSFTRSSHALDAFCSSGPSPTAIERFGSPRCRNRRCTTLGRSIGVHLFVTNDDQPAQLSALFDGQYVIIGLTQGHHTLFRPAGLSQTDTTSLIGDATAWLNVPDREILSPYEAVQRVSAELIIDARNLSLEPLSRRMTVAQASVDFRVGYALLDDTFSVRQPLPFATSAMVKHGLACPQEHSIQPWTSDMRDGFIAHDMVALQTTIALQSGGA